MARVTILLLPVFVLLITLMVMGCGGIRLEMPSYTSGAVTTAAAAAAMMDVTTDTEMSYAPVSLAATDSLYSVGDYHVSHEGDSFTIILYTESDASWTVRDADESTVTFAENHVDHAASGKDGKYTYISGEMSGKGDTAFALSYGRSDGSSTLYYEVHVSADQQGIGSLYLDSLR